MSRLTEKEIDLIRAARNTGEQGQAGAAHVVQNAQRLQSKAFGELLASGAAAVASWTGLAGLVSFLDEAILRELRGALRRRAAASQLKRLDDHLLRDIGLDRGTVETFVETLSTDQIEPVRKARPKNRGFRHWLQRRQAIRELEALDDRQLTDIGIVRGAIPMAVDEAMAEKVRRENQVSPAQKQGLTQHAMSSSIRLQHRPVDRAVAAPQHPSHGLPLLMGPWLELSLGRDVR
jgi:uncharacterized protein YjiS (DUF1127 family)